MSTTGDPMLVKVSDDTLLGRLLSRGCEFEFFHAVWLLERAAGERIRVGERGPVAKEAFRFRPDVSLGFPPSDVRRITAYEDEYSHERYYQFDVTFLGLYGSSTPLPVHYAIDILRGVDAGTAKSAYEQQAAAEVGESGFRASRTPERDFLDLVHHRLTSLFYRSWLKYRYDRAFAVGGRDALTSYLLWLIGSSPDFDESTLGVPPVRMLRYAGTMTQHPKSAAALEGVLVDYWKDYPLRVEQCMGRWVPIAPADQNRLGMRNCALGVDFSAGEQLYDLNGSFCVSLGPVDWETYQSFLPDGQRFAETQAVTSMCCSDPLTFAVEITIQEGEIPEMRLGAGDDGARLGYTSWARTDDLPETSVLFPALTGNRKTKPERRDVHDAPEAATVEDTW